MLQRNEFSIKKAMLVVMRNNKTHKLAKPLKPSIDLDNIDISADVLKQCTLIMAYILQQDDTYPSSNTEQPNLKTSGNRMS